MLTKARQMIFNHVPGVLSTKSGTEPLTFDKSFNHVFTGLTVFGNTIEIGTGDKSPDNPYAFKSFNGKVYSRGKNFIPLSSLTYGFIDGTGFETNWTGYWKTDYLPVPKSTPLCYTPPTFDGIPLSPELGRACYFHQYNKDFVRKSTTNMSGSLTKTVTTRSDCRYVRISGAPLDWAVLDSYAHIDTIQLELGDTATPYSPFVGDEIEIPYTMRSAVGITDEYNTVNGVFTKRLDEVAFNGTEFWYYNTTTSTDSYTTIYLGASGLGMLVDSFCLCTHFPDEYTGGLEYWRIGSLFNLRFANSRLGVTSENTQAERLAAAKAWLATQNTAGTPVTIQYELATPVTSTLTPAKLKTYYPFTQLYTDSEVPATIEATTLELP